MSKSMDDAESTANEDRKNESTGNKVHVFPTCAPTPNEHFAFSDHLSPFDDIQANIMPKQVMNFAVSKAVLDLMPTAEPFHGWVVTSPSQ